VLKRTKAGIALYVRYMPNELTALLLQRT